MRLLDGSGVSREVHAPFWERPGVQFLRPTQHNCNWTMDVIWDEDTCGRVRARAGYPGAGAAAIDGLQSGLTLAVSLLAEARKKSSRKEKMERMV